MVECVEELCPELEITVFIKTDLLGDREVRISQPRTTHYSNPSVTESLRRRPRYGERIRIKPPLYGPLRPWQFRISDKIRPPDSITAESKNRASAQSCRQR